METTKTRSSVKENSSIDQVSKVSLAIMATASALVGLWAVSCLVGAAISVGPLGVLTGWFSSIGF